MEKFEGRPWREKTRVWFEVLAGVEVTGPYIFSSVLPTVSPGITNDSQEERSEEEEMSYAMDICCSHREQS
ncbi:hypothetical protein EYF80_012003 [Liparis tanakae]|uniref:Uncharacterized protein n=1 Tax=Liparis tanakae TaxID=230148 RepID=A0A4Z2IIW5_9TELE|nr:hypothetical protein EYF80_012003 [Liparis tanakae]